MKLSEYRKLISHIQSVLPINKERPIAQIYKAFLDAFPGQVPDYYRATAAYNEVKEAPEKKRAIKLLREIFPRHQNLPDILPIKNIQNSKYGTRRDPFAVTRPKQNMNDWKEKYYDPTIIFGSPEAIGDFNFCNKVNEELYRHFKSTGNLLYVLEAFFRHVDFMILGDMEDNRAIKIPAWIATSLADGFKQYYSRKIVGKEENFTLDAAFGIEGKKKQEAFNPYTVDTRTLVEMTREVQWHCNLKFTTAIKFARRILEVLYIARFEGDIPHRFIHAEINSICTQESKGAYPSYMAWCEDKKFIQLAGKDIRDRYLDLIETLSPELKKELTAKIENPKKHLFTSNL